MNAPDPSHSPSPHHKPATVACFAIQAAAEPGAMVRVLEQFARRSLLPSRWHSTAAPGGALQIDVQVRDMPRDAADRMAIRIRGLIDVSAVLTSEKSG